MRSGGSDLICGIVAAVGFLVMIFLLQFPVWLGILLAGGLYGGTWLATRAALPAARPRLDEEALLRQIAGLYRSVPNPQVQARIAEITQQARAFLAFLNEHPDRAAAWREIVRDCLESTYRIVGRYVEIARFMDDPRQQSLAEVESLLGQVATTFATLRHRLVDEGAADLSAEMEVFRGTLQAVNEVNVQNELTVGNQSGGDPR